MANSEDDLKFWREGITEAVRAIKAQVSSPKSGGRSAGEGRSGGEGGGGVRERPATVMVTRDDTEWSLERDRRASEPGREGGSGSQGPDDFRKLQDRESEQRAQKEREEAQRVQAEETARLELERAREEQRRAFEERQRQRASVVLSSSNEDILSVETTTTTTTSLDTPTNAAPEPTGDTAPALTIESVGVSAEASLGDTSTGESKNPEIVSELVSDVNPEPSPIYVPNEDISETAIPVEATLKEPVSAASDAVSAASDDVTTQPPEAQTQTDSTLGSSTWQQNIPNSANSSSDMPVLGASPTTMTTTTKTATANGLEPPPSVSIPVSPTTSTTTLTAPTTSTDSGTTRVHGAGEAEIQKSHASLQDSGEHSVIPSSIAPIAAMSTTPASPPPKRSSPPASPRSATTTTTTATTTSPPTTPRSNPQVAGVSQTRARNESTGILFIYLKNN